MTDKRRLWSKEVLLIDDKNYLVKLLSELQIVKWTPAQIVEPTSKDPTAKEAVLDYRHAPLENLAEKNPHLKLAVSGYDDIPDTYKNPHISKNSLETLKKLFPPQEWTSNGVRYRQEISPAHASRLELALLRDGIRTRMMEANARITGICPIRENLTMRCLDEMIRISTIACAERGLLFSIVRDEMRMTMCCYKTLLASAIDYGREKFRQSMSSTESLKHELERLKAEKDQLRIGNQELRIEMKLMDRKFTDEHLAVEESRKQALGNIKRTCDQFIGILDTIGVEKSMYRHLLT